MTTALLTFHACINYGSYWQSRCLLEGLAARGHPAVLLDHSSRRVERAEWKCALRPTLPAPVTPGDPAQYRQKLRSFLSAVEALPRTRRFELDRPDRAGAFDLVVVGSDEVWNLAHPWYGTCPLFFGEGLQARRLVSYACSFGNWTAAEGLHPGWAQRLRGFESLSVRDENSRRLVRQALGVEPAMALDPCLQFAAPSPAPGPSEAREVVVYGHGFSPWFTHRAKHWARRRGLRLVSVGYRNDWADRQWLSAAPQEFADAVGGARAVLTNFFHGCVFALRTSKPFLCEQSPYRSIKIRDLVADLHCHAHLATEDMPEADSDRALDQPLAPHVLQRLAVRRRETEAYLDRAIPRRTAKVPSHAAAC